MLPALPSGSAVLLFGLCTAWRSNDRIRAAEHRVADVVVAAADSARRLSLLCSSWVSHLRGCTCLLLKELNKAVVAGRIAMSISMVVIPEHTRLVRDDS